MLISHKLRNRRDTNLGVRLGKHGAADERANGVDQELHVGDLCYHDKQMRYQSKQIQCI